MNGKVRHHIYFKRNLFAVVVSLVSSIICFCHSAQVLYYIDVETNADFQLPSNLLDSKSYQAAAFVVPFNLICNMTMF